MTMRARDEDFEHEHDEPRSQQGDLRTDELGEEAIAKGARMGEARLGGERGYGTLQIVRGRDGSVIEAKGTWRSAKDDARDDGVLARLCDAADSGDTVQYQGPIVDPDSDRDRVKVDVAFTSTARYVYDATVNDGEEAPERRIFNFRPVEGEWAR